MVRLYSPTHDDFITDRNQIIDVLVRGTARLMTIESNWPYRGNPKLTPAQRSMLLLAAKGGSTQLASFEDFVLHALYHAVRERWRAANEPLTLQYRIDHDAYYLVAGDRTEAIPMPIFLHQTLTEIEKPKASRTRVGGYGEHLVPWPPRGASNVVPFA